MRGIVYNKLARWRKFKKKETDMKHSCLTYIATVLLVAVLLLSMGLTSCASKAPELSEVKDTFVALIEASYEINDIFFGEGLPTHDRDSEFAKENNIYYGFYGYDAYEYVTEDSPYFYIEDIKYAASEVYSADYLEEIYTMAFTGYADENTGAVSTARYLEAEGILLRYAFGDKDPFCILPGDRRYLFDTMEIVRPSNGKSVNVTVESYLVGQEDEILAVTLRFVLEEDGWRLDTPTY